MRRKRNYNYSPYSRRRRIRWDNVLKVVIPVAVVLVLVITFNFSRIRLAMKGYSWTQQSAVLKLTSDKVKIVIDDDYLNQNNRLHIEPYESVFPLMVKTNKHSVLYFFNKMMPIMSQLKTIKKIQEKKIKK